MWGGGRRLINLRLNYSRSYFPTYIVPNLPLLLFFCTMPFGCAWDIWGPTHILLSRDSPNKVPYRVNLSCYHLQVSYLQRPTHMPFNAIETSMYVLMLASLSLCFGILYGKLLIYLCNIHSRLININVLDLDGICSLITGIAMLFPVFFPLVVHCSVNHEGVCIRGSIPPTVSYLKTPTHSHRQSYYLRQSHQTKAKK